ncbi:MAG: HAMP domain-containing protein [Hungatella sp.]|jgi:two-component system sensor histidine kinase VanS|nr:HAMP domain-containing protein [Hungatella sp.]
MKRSIRIRFTMIFIGLMAGIFVGIWCVNNWMLEWFYINQKVDALQLGYTRMNELVMERWESGGSINDEFITDSYGEEVQTPAIELLRSLGDQYNITMVIIDSFSNTPVVASTRDVRFMMDRVFQYMVGRNNPRTELILKEDNYTIQKTYDTRSKSFYLESWGYYGDNRTIFMMSIPLASIRESVQLSNKFLAYVGIMALVLSSIVVYFTTKKVTSPILQLAHISERMSNLDFDAKYQGNAQDEIGILGNSVNTLSDKLKETIGELKSANNQLLKDIEEKNQIDEMRQEFIGNVSHELKTPIALIQGYAEGLTEGMAQDKESRDYYCEVIMDEANKMNTMVRQLLTLNALESGNDMVTMERFDLVELIQGVLAAARILIEQKQAKIIFYCDHPVYVWADEFKIEEVVTNYVSNALNHLDGKKIICITIEELGDNVRVAVRNTGTLIPQEALSNLWTKFYKVDKARTRAYGGSGIGLSIVKAIMDSHHKECGVRNVEDGVEFWFTLDSKV